MVWRSRSKRPPIRYSWGTTLPSSSIAKRTLSFLFQKPRTGSISLEVMSRSQKFTALSAMMSLP